MNMLRTRGGQASKDESGTAQAPAQEATATRRPLVSLVTCVQTSPSEAQSQTSAASSVDSSQSPSPDSRSRGSHATPWTVSHHCSNPTSARTSASPPRGRPGKMLAQCLSDDSMDSEEEEELRRQQEQEIARRERMKNAREAAQGLPRDVQGDEEEARRAEQMAMIALLREQNLLDVKGLHSDARILLPRHKAAMSLQSQAGDLCRDARLELLDSVTTSSERRNFRVSLTLTLEQPYDNSKKRNPCATFTQILLISKS